MTLKEVLILAAAGYTKADIDALDAPAAPAAPQTPAAPAAPSVPQTPAAPAQDVHAAPAVPPTTLASSMRFADVTAAPQSPTMADVMQAITNLSARITPAPTFQQTPTPRGVDDIVTGFLGIDQKGGVNNG